MIWVLKMTRQPSGEERSTLSMKILLLLKWSEVFCGFYCIFVIIKIVGYDFYLLRKTIFNWLKLMPYKNWNLHLHIYFLATCPTTEEFFACTSGERAIMYVAKGLHLPLIALDRRYIFLSHSLTIWNTAMWILIPFNPS